jgi:hypothetical protein
MEKLRKLTQMTEHPEQYSDKEWQEVFEGETISQEQIDQAWQRFEKEHPRRPNRSILKIAASFIGILLLSGIAVAAILHTTKPDVYVTETTKTEVRADNETSPATTTSAQEPHTVIFENTELQQIVDSLAIYYKVKPYYRRESSRQLRLYYEWDQHNSISEITSLLNNFEQVCISLRGDSIIIE